MKLGELKNFDIVVVETRWLGRPTVYYVVIGDKMVSCKGDVNGTGDSRPAGWYDRTNLEDDLPYGTIKVYRPKWFGDTFNGDFENESLYDCIYSRE
jgi:hypothetical protein